MHLLMNFQVNYYCDYYEFLALFPCFSESMLTKVEGVRKGVLQQKEQVLVQNEHVVKCILLPSVCL